MEWLNILTARLRAFVRREEVIGEIEEEMRFHVEMEAEANIERGMRPEEAQRAALRSFGNPGRLRDLAYEVRGGGMLETLWQDLRHGARLSLKQPGFTLVAVMTLALGIGANTAIFSVVQTVLLRPLPFMRQERLAVAWKTDETSSHAFIEISIPEFNDWRSQSQVFENLAAMTTTVYGFSYMLTGRGEAAEVNSARVSADFFPTLGVNPALGRAFTPDEDRPGEAGVVVISHQLWQGRFGGDPDLIGQMITLNDGGKQAALEAAVNPNPSGPAIRLNDIGMTVIGVMPADFEFPKGVDIWVPLSATSGKALVENRIGFLQAVGRLKPAVTLEQAQAELDTIIRRVAAEHPEMKASAERSVVKPLARHIFGDARPALYLLLAATALLLLIACANIANLMLARATSRRKEIAVRAALGASRDRIARQLMSESLVLAVAGGGLGTLLAYLLIGMLPGLAPADIPRIEAVRMNGRVLFFTFGLTFLSAFICGLAPALITSKVNLNEALAADSSRVGGEPRGNRLRGALVVGQVAVTLMLLIGAGLISRSFLNLQQVDLGFDPRNVVTLQLQLHGEKYPDVESTRDYIQQLLERVEAQPGIISAGAALIRPLEAPIGWYVRYAAEGQPPDEVMRNEVLNCESITPHYLRSIGIPLKAGREFTEQDDADAPQVVIISEALSRRIVAPGVDPLGKRINLGGQGWCTIVGIAGDARLREIKEAGWNVYVPYRQFPYPVTCVTVRAASDPSSIIAMVRGEVTALDPDQAVTSVKTMEEVVSTALARPRFNTLLLNLLSATAALLAGVGIYGVISYSVMRRTREIGIRMALGAQTHDVVKLVMMQGAKLALVGIGLGMVGAVCLTGLMENLLFEVSATDPLTFAIIALLLTAVALLACWLPTRKATKVDPLVALKFE
ncbi:MAG TPA: ABC transporter permease [Blastocatellia bacterium]|nr:ABC transporter permease [Blastocatellia bacterium]